MRKITFYLMMLLSITAFSQIEIVENFDNTPNNQMPAGWTSTGFGATTSFVCSGTGKDLFKNINGGLSVSATTPNYTAISNGTNLTASFSYNVFQYSFFGGASAPPADWGTIVMEYSTDGGTTWNNITTINDSNFTYVDTDNCGTTGDISVGIIADGSDFQARVVATNNAGNPIVYFVIDNVSITQVATTVPNCDATLISPAAGSNTAESDVTLTWQAATGFATSYTVSVGSSTGATDIVNEETTTETSYNLTGLDYETEYFVTIVPSNGFGAATGCSEESFTTRVAPIAGASCSSPIVVSSFPYVAVDNTANYEDNFDASPCNNSYMNGKDVFYEITPTTDVSLNIELQNIDNNGASIHVVEGCIDTAENCVAYVGSFSGDSRSLTEVVLFAGTTYYLVLSNSGNTRTYGYTMIISANSCINPAMTLNPVPDCDSAQFNVDVDVTYLGSATDLTLADNFGNTNTTISSTGVVTFGPYPSGSTVDFTLTNNQDGSCSYADSTFFYCPPSNDECGASTVLTINTDGSCTSILAASNVGATQSSADLTSCGGSTNNDVWFSFVATSETLILEYSNVVAVVGSGGIVQATELLEGSCGALTSLSCATGDYVTLSGLTVNNTYYIRNYTNLGEGYAQDYDICLREQAEAPVNDECTGATTLTASTDDMCNNQVAGTTNGATQSAESTCGDGYNDVWYVFNPAETGVYEFSLDYTGTTTRYFIYEGTCGAFTEKSTSCTTNANQIFTLDSAQSYYVMVRTSQSGPGVDFNLCVTQLPPAVSNNDCSSPITIQESLDANGNNSISGNLDNAYPSPENCNQGNEAVWYNFTPTYTGTYYFEFTRVSGNSSFAIFNGDCSNLTQDVSGLESCFLSGSRSGDLVAGTTYMISVHNSVAASFELFIYPDASLSVDSESFESFKYYPNPVVNTLTVEAKNSISNISIFNIVGQQVQAITPNDLNATLDMNELNDGVYFVKVTINGAQKTFKVIKK